MFRMKQLTIHLWRQNHTMNGKFSYSVNGLVMRSSEKESRSSRRFSEVECTHSMGVESERVNEWWRGRVDETFLHENKFECPWPDDLANEMIIKSSTPPPLNCISSLCSCRFIHITNWTLLLKELRNIFVYLFWLHSLDFSIVILLALWFLSHLEKFMMGEMLFINKMSSVQWRMRQMLNGCGANA